jgi:hypothetical protein
LNCLHRLCERWQIREVVDQRRLHLEIVQVHQSLSISCPICSTASTYFCTRILSVINTRCNQTASLRILRYRYPASQCT